MPTEQSWSRFYASGADLPTFLQTLHFHAPLMEAILAGHPASALEAGCGTAVMSAFLQLAGVEAIAVDNDPGVLDVARAAAAPWPAPPQFVEHDIFKLDELDRRVDVVFSQGVLEHFSDDDIVALTRQALAVAPRFVFSVPSNYYGHKDFGNERLMTTERWREILAPEGSVEVRGYFLARRRYTYGLRRPLMVLASVERS